MGYTDRWGFKTLGPGDHISDEGYKFSDADIRWRDRLLEYAVEGHHHTGEPGVDRTPVTSPDLTLLTEGGAMPTGQRYFYRYTIVNEDGDESAASPSTYVDTPAPLGLPDAPALSYVTGSGDLEPGGYSYVLSAYRDVTLLETKAVNSAFITIPGSNPNNEITLLMPALPPGADGFNIYRKSPTGMHFLYIDSTSASSWTDDGSIDGDCDRSLPATNRSSSTNAVTIAIPGATPFIEEGWSWRIYRTDDPSDWNSSYLTDVVPVGSPLSTPVTFDDVGGNTQLGSPPETAQVFNAPEKIDLTDAAEVQGFLPPGKNVIPFVPSFVMPGLVEEGEGLWTWVCEFDEADIQYVRAYLGIGAAPASQDLIVDLNIFRSGSWISAFDDDLGLQPRIEIGEMVGEIAVPVHQHIELGDVLAIDVDQAGGGATPTDFNLTVNVLLMARRGSTSTTYSWTSS